MSPASYLTAPPRDAVTIGTAVGVWIALALLAVGVVAGILLRGRARPPLWHQIKRTGSSFTAESERIAETSAQMQVHLDRASASGARLAGATERLATSRARLEVQLQGVQRGASHDAPAPLAPARRLNPTRRPRALDASRRAVTVSTCASPPSTWARTRHACSSPTSSTASSRRSFGGR